MARSKHSPLLAGGISKGVVGSVTIKPGFKHGMKKLLAFSANIETGTAPGVNSSVVTTVDNKDGTFTVYVWMPTSNANPTLIASTVATDIRWMAIGGDIDPSLGGETA